MGLIFNENKREFAEMLEYVDELASFLYEAQGVRSINPFSLKKLQYLAEADQVDEYAYLVIAPKVKQIAEFASANLYYLNPQTNKRVYNLSNFKSSLQPAIDQLKDIGKQLNIEVYEEGKDDPVKIASNAIQYAKENKFDYVLIDTAGRLHIDDELMDELENINNKVNPQEILLVIDAMMGQDAINVITGFNDKLKLSGCVHPITQQEMHLMQQRLRKC